MDAATQTLAPSSNPAIELPPGWQVWPSYGEILAHTGNAEFKRWLARRPSGELLLGHFDEERTFAYARGFAFADHPSAKGWRFCAIDDWARPVNGAPAPEAS
jgi:hypothetical protein